MTALAGYAPDELLGLLLRPRPPRRRRRVTPSRRATISRRRRHDRLPASAAARRGTRDELGPTTTARARRRRDPVLLARRHRSARPPPSSRAASPSRPPSPGSASSRCSAALDALDRRRLPRRRRDALQVDSAYVLEHLGDGLMRVRAGVGWRGLRRLELRGRQRSRRAAATRYAAAPVVIEDLPNDPSGAPRPLRDARRRLQRHVAGRQPGRPAGLLGAAQPRRSARSARTDLDFLQAVAHVLTGAIEGLRAEERIRHDALHDALTGLPNRALLLDRLQRRARARRRASGAQRRRCCSSTSTT